MKEVMWLSYLLWYLGFENYYETMNPLTNEQDGYAIAVSKDRIVIGHLP